jgi:hypothetical protein
VAIETVNTVKNEFHRDNGIWPALGIVVLLCQDTPVADIVEVMVEQFTESTDKIHPDAKECVARLVVYGDPEELQMPGRSGGVSMPGTESKIDRFVRIRGEERKASLRKILESDLPDQDKKDVMDVFVAIMDAVNAWIRKEDRFINPQVVDTALSEFLDESRRINRRMGGE